MQQQREAQPALAPIVTSKGNQIVANSRDVAEFFGKRHDNVLRDIDGLIEVGVLNFEGCPYRSVEGGRTYRSFEMDRDGFSLLAMGFTGAKALQFKLAYIAAFNDMERRLVMAPVLPDFTNPALAARAWADEVEQKMEAQKQIEVMKPLALIGQRAADHNHTLTRWLRTFPGVNTMKGKRTLRARPEASVWSPAHPLGH